MGDAAQQPRVARKSDNPRKRTYSKIRRLQNFFLQFARTFEGFSRSVARLRSFLRNADR
jgi:hypothetical protein